MRQERLLNLAQARAVLEARAQERYALEQAEYEAQMQAREERAKETGRKPGGRAPKPPVPGPRDQDQYNFTDPNSRIMKNRFFRNLSEKAGDQAIKTRNRNILVGNEKSASHFGQKRGHSGKMVRNRNRVKELNIHDH